MRRKSKLCNLVVIGMVLFGMTIGELGKVFGEKNGTEVLTESLSYMSSNASKSEYTDVGFVKNWDDDEEKPSKLIVDLYANNKKIDEVEINEGNDWSAMFQGLPVYDESGKKIDYLLKDRDGKFAAKSNSFVVEDSAEIYVMLNGTKDLDVNAEYLLVASNWYKYMNWGEYYYYFFLNRDGTETISLNEQDAYEMFMGPKTGDSNNEICFGDECFGEWLNPNMIDFIDDDYLWKLVKSDNNEMKNSYSLVDLDGKKSLVLKGENIFPRAHSIIYSDKEEWSDEENTNYSNSVYFEDANDGLIKIKGVQMWEDQHGILAPEYRYVYMDINPNDPDEARVAATDFWMNAGQFKFFTKKSITLQTAELVEHIDVDIKSLLTIKPEELKDTKVYLYNGDKLVETVYLNDFDNDKNYTIAYVPKYDENDKTIKYTLKLDNIEGYTTYVTGDYKGGFVLNQSDNPETSDIVLSIVLVVAVALGTIIIVSKNKPMKFDNV